MSTRMDNPLEAINNIVPSNSVVTNTTINGTSMADAQMTGPQGSGSATLVSANNDANDANDAAGDYEIDNVNKNEKVINKPSGIASQPLLKEKVALSSDKLTQFEYSQQEYEQWQAFIEEQVGFILPSSQRNWLWQAINRLSRKAKLSAEDLLNHAKKDKSLIQEVIEAVLIPQSHFFRHQPTLDFILHHAQQVFLIQKKAQADSFDRSPNPSKALGSSSKQVSQQLPKQAQSEGIASVAARHTDLNRPTKASPSNPHNTTSSNNITAINNDNDDKNLSDFKVWSVGCSFGQEAWSIAMTLDEAGLLYKIWGLDVNKSALKHAEKGRYDLKQLDEIPYKYRKFVNIKGQHWRIVPSLKKHLTFLHYNLITSQLPDLPLVNVIICQNVLIYFRHFEQRDILARLVKRLKVGGYIVLAPGEASQWQHPEMRRQNDLQVNAWQKVL